MITKQVLRKSLLCYRQLMPTPVYEHRNLRMVKLLESFISQRTISSIHTFLSIKKNKEPDTAPLFSPLWRSGVKIVVPKTIFSSRKMAHFYLKSNTKLKTNNWGIPEPINAKEANVSDVDIVLVPLLLADKCGNRIGYGGGYYDRFLKESSALKVGLNLAEPVDQILQKEEWDTPLDVLITPQNVYEFART